MSKNYVFEKQLISGKWVNVCVSHKHMPMIICLKDGTYKVQGSDGKPRIEKDFKSAMKFAIATYKKMAKFNKNWDAENDN